MNTSESIPSIITPYQKYPFLIDYREFFWDLKNEDILGEWNFGIIIAWPWREKVYKIWKTVSASQELENEYQNHVNFYLWVWENWIHWNIRVPMVSIEPKKVKNDTWQELIIYEMERVHGISLLRYDLMKNYQKELAWLDHLSDNKLLSILHKNGSLSETEYLLIYSNAIRILRENLPDHSRELENLLERLKWNWIEHLDLHAWNIMIDIQWSDDPKIYIIDFGKATRNS